MFFSKIWTLLITLMAIILAVSFLLAPKPAEYNLHESLEKQVDVAQGLIDMHLRSESRKRLDVLSNMGKDPRLLKPLSALIKATGTEAAAAQTQIDQLLKEANQKSGLRAQSLILTDTTGRVRAALGEGGKTGDNVAGLPEVQLALRSTCSDNTSARGDKIFWVYACPVRSVRLGEKIELMGAIRAEMELDSGFSKDLLQIIGAAEAAGKKSKQSRLNIALCFFIGGNPKACSAPSDLWSKHGPAIYKKHQKEVEDPTIGRTPAVPVLLGKKDRYLMVVGKLRGSASKKGSNFWAILWKFPEGLGAWAFKSGKIPRSYLLSGFPYVLVITAGFLALVLGIFFIVMEGDRPLRKLLNQARSVADGSAEKLDDTRFRGKFSLIAIALNEGLEHAAAGSGKAQLHGKNLDSILGELEPQIAQEDYTPPPVSGATAMPSSPPSPPVPPPKPPKVKEQKPPPLPPVGGLEPSPLDSVLPPLETKAPAADHPYQGIFEDYRKTKQQCGEDTSSLSMEGFAAQLDKNRQQIIASQGCKDVRFEVYVKDGKAALKAHPIK